MRKEIVHLTRRQQEVLEGVWKNETSQQTAQRLSIDESTVNTIKKTLLVKLELTDEAALSSLDVRTHYGQVQPA